MYFGNICLWAEGQSSDFQSVVPLPPILFTSLLLHILALSGVAVEVAWWCFSLAKCNWERGAHSLDLLSLLSVSLDMHTHTTPTLLFLHPWLLGRTLYPFIPIFFSFHLHPFSFPCLAVFHFSVSLHSSPFHFCISWESSANSTLKRSQLLSWDFFFSLCSLY